MNHGRVFVGTAQVALLLAAGTFAAEAQQTDDCGDRASLRVSVVDESGLISIPSATIVLRWTESEAARRPIRRESGPEGRLALCAPRDAWQATLWAEFGDASSEEVVVGIEPGVAHDVELRLRIGSVRTGRLIGRVRDARTDDPVVAAEVSIQGHATVAETNRRGQFVLSAVPTGIHALSVRHLGYADLSHPVTVSRGITTEVDVGVVPDPVEMEPIVATATRPRRLEIKGFYERRYWGELVAGGDFFTAVDIERRRPVQISHMIADLPGIRLDCTMRRVRCRIINTRGASGFVPGGCVMSTYLDGMSLLSRQAGPRDTIDELVRPGEIAGVEVYRGPASVPAEFSGSDSGCGVIVIWTK